MSRIVFSCPCCAESMDIGAHMAGRQVQCVECNAAVMVPYQSEELRSSRMAGHGRRSNCRKLEKAWLGEDRPLTGNEVLLISILFFFIPAANVWVSSILYYVWKKEHPTRAGQINRLGFLIFAIHVVIAIIAVILAFTLFRPVQR